MTIMKIDISIHASQLKNVAGAFKGTSDPFAVVTKIASRPGAQPEVLGKTEVIKNTLSPQWVKVFTTDYELGTPCTLAVSIFDEIKKGNNKPMGSASFEIGELLGAQGSTKAKRLQKGGTLFATARKSQGSGILRFQMQGFKLKNVEGLFGKSDPFFEVSRKVGVSGGLTWDNIYRSEVKRDNLNPQWNAAEIELDILCGGNLDAPIQVSIYDFERSGKHVSMGSFESTVNGIVRAAQTGEAIKVKLRFKETGTVRIVRAEVIGQGQNPMAGQYAAATPAFNPAASTGAYPTHGGTPMGQYGAPMGQYGAPMGQYGAAPNSSMYATPGVGSGGYGPTAGAMAGAMGGAALHGGVPVMAATPGRANFVDYVAGGCELNVVVAIDFTGSNGDPRKPGTLHYMHSGGKNDYERAIAAIVSILAKYDTDQMFPVFGFGAKYGGVVRHCFQCGPLPEAHGVQGVLDAYKATFRSGFVMSGPTVFTEVIDMAASRARESLDKAMRNRRQAYTILLILTDGAVSDINMTAQCIARAADSPLSIVIVGLGNADFSAMQFLDDSASPGKRDIAQFVQFNRHCASSVDLTSETLREIPDQLTQFFQSREIAPLPAVHRGDNEIVVESEEQEIDLSLDVRQDDDIVVTGGGQYVDDGFASAFGKR